MNQRNTTLGRLSPSLPAACLVVAAAAFYKGDQFPPEYRNLPFAAQHGSWNRSRRTGYKVIYMPMQGGRATGEYVDFLTGFVTPEGDVWGRPVAVATGRVGVLGGFVSLAPGSRN